MLNLNNAQQNDGPSEFSLIPNGTICRAVIIVKMGEMEIPEFGRGQWFKRSASSQAKWMELEFTVLGGDFDRRKFWDRIFVDGDKMGESGIPQAKEIGLSNLRAIIESAKNLDPSDMSELAQSARNINGVDALNMMEICAKIGVKKGTNGYQDSNRLLSAMTPNQTGFISVGSTSQPQAQPQAVAQKPSATATSGVAPSWAGK